MKSSPTPTVARAIAKAGSNGPSTREVKELFDTRYHALAARYDRLLAWLIGVQWIGAIGFAQWYSPLAWAGKQSEVHAHVWAALVVGGAISAFPLGMALMYPGRRSTRIIIAVGQVTWSALLIHLTGGRIETHFHIFASLAILAFYRDVGVMLPAAALVTFDHFARGLYWPESVYGVLNPEWWRFLEHAGWVLFLNGFLLYNCVQARKELWLHCEQHVALSDATTAAARMEKLAALGQLAASVGHELRNPLAAIRNARTFIGRRLASNGEVDPKVDQFLDLISREVDASGKIIADLLEFSRPRALERSPCPLHPLVEEAIAIVPPRANVVFVNALLGDLPVPDIDKDQIRQVLANLIQNASEAVTAGEVGTVTVRGMAGAAGECILLIEDDGCGIPEDVLAKVFQPLFSTKTKGTGLGLAVVHGIVERHGGTLSVESIVGSGTTFKVVLPTHPPQTDAPGAE